MLSKEQLRQYADFKLLMAEAKAMEKQMKAEVDSEFESRYLEDGTRTRDVLEDGEKLAALTWVPGTPPKDEEVLLIDDPAAFGAWCIENGFVVPDEEGALAHLKETGEMPDGCGVTTVPKGGRSGYVKVTAEKPYKERFAERARKLLGGER